MRVSFQTVTAIACVCFFASTSRSATIHVPADQPTIQAGIDAAVDGDTVLVADGVYTGDGNRDIDFRGKGIVVASEHGPAVTIIDCQGAQQNPHRGFVFCQGEDSATLLWGFTITNGFAPVYPGLGAVGGGIMMTGATPLVINCMLVDCFASNGGGGIAATGCIGLRLDSCRFERNGTSARGPSNTGGGIACRLSRVALSHCSFSNNRAPFGGGLAIEGSELEMFSCVVSHNLAYGWGGDESESPGIGGGIYVINSTVLINGMLAINNVADAMFGLEKLGGRGGGIAALSSSITVLSATISGNSALSITGFASGEGGGMYLSNATAHIGGSILSFASDGGSIQCDSANALTSIYCSDLFGNSGGDWTPCIVDQESIQGNMILDPLFCDTSQSNYSLKPLSPCLPTNNDCQQAIGYTTAICAPTDVGDGDLIEVPSSYMLEQNYPNPFNPSTTIQYDLAHPGPVQVTVYNALGQFVRTLVDATQPAGRHVAEWDGLNNSGEQAASGLYFCRLSAGDRSATRKMLLVK